MWLISGYIRTYVHTYVRTYIHTYVRTNAKTFAMKKARASGRNVGKVFNPVLKLVFENYPFSCLSQLRSPHFNAKTL